MAQTSSSNHAAVSGDRETPRAVRQADIVPMVWLSCGLAALAGLLFGMDIGVSSGALPFIKNDFNVSNFMEGWIVSSMMVGAALGALGAGWVSKTLGRRRALLSSSLLFVGGAVHRLRAVLRARDQGYFAGKDRKESILRQAAT